MSYYKRAAARREQARRQQFILIGVIVVLSLVAVVFIIALNASANAAPTGDLILPEAANYPQANGKTLGPAEAPLVVSEFADFQCPYCGLFHSDVQGALIERYLGTGQVRFEFHHLIVVDSNVGGNESRQAAIASECALNQGRFWDYHALLFTNQDGEGRGAFRSERLLLMADALDLNRADFETCLTAPEPAAAVRADEQLARQLGLNSTPTLLVNDVRLPNPLDFDQVTAYIDSALAQLP